MSGADDDPQPRPRPSEDIHCHRRHRPGDRGWARWWTGRRQYRVVIDGRWVADPYNDHEPVDSSAAAIAAQGFLRLGRYLDGKGEDGSRYRRPIVCRDYQDPIELFEANTTVTTGSTVE